LNLLYIIFNAFFMPISDELKLICIPNFAVTNNIQNKQDKILNSNKRSLSPKVYDCAPITHPLDIFISLDSHFLIIISIFSTKNKKKNNSIMIVMLKKIKCFFFWKLELSNFLAGISLQPPPSYKMRPFIIKVDPF